VARSENCLKKLDRMNKTLRHEEADRVPISDFFWLTFIDRWREELDLPSDASPYKHYDLDWICTTPNLDPHIREFEVIKSTEDEEIVRTGFEAVVRHKKGAQMPYFEKFETDTVEKMLAFQFDDPWDERRYFKSGDNQLNGVSEVITRNTPPWVETVKSLYDDFPVYGSVCESMEEGWRIIGSENILLWSALYPDELETFLKRVANFIPEQEIIGDANGGDLLVIGWGGTFGALNSAVKELREEGYNVSLAQFNYIYPLPKNTEEVFGKFKKHLVCELNLGQFAEYLRSQYPQFKYEQFNKVQGLPFFIKELKNKFKEILEEK